MSAPLRAVLALLCLPGLTLADDAPAAPGAAGPAWLLEPEEDPPLPRWGRGPLEVRDPFILALPRLSPWARSPRIHEHLELGLSARGTWSNSFAFEPGRYLVDGEVRQVDFVARLGLFDRFELGLLLPYQWRGGGVMDGFIEGFHDAFDLPQNRRDRLKRGRWTVNGVDPAGRSFRWDRKGHGLGDLIAEGRALLTRGGPLLPAAAVGLRVRLPTGARRFDFADGVDASLSIDLSQRLGERSPFIVYAGGAWTYHTDARVNGLVQARNRGMFYLGGEVELTRWLSIVGHAWIESRRELRLFADLPLVLNPRDPRFGSRNLDFGNWVTYAAVAFKLEPVEGLTIELGMLENIVDPETTADFTLVFGLGWTI